jgi:hypothetical protein
MPAWLSEGSLLAYFLCAALGLVCLVSFWTTRKGKLLIGVAVAVLLVLGLFLIDFSIETDREQVERKVQEFASAVERGDIDTLGDHIDPAFKSGDFLSRERLLSDARKYLQAGEKRRVSLGPPDLKFQSKDRVIAITDYTAHGIFAGQDIPPQMGKLELTYVKKDGQWRIESMELLTLQGERRGIPR